MNSYGLKINHLAYEDDVIIFISWDIFSLNLILRQLKKYEEVPGQKINPTKSCFLTASHADKKVRKRVRRLTGFKYQEFHVTYLGCPIYTGRKKITHFADITSKILKNIGGWQGRLLSPRG